MHKYSVLGIKQSTWLLLSQGTLAERRDKSRVSLGLGQRKGLLMLKLLQVFWLSSPWMEQLSFPAEAAEKCWGPVYLITTHQPLCHGHFRCILDLGLNGFTQRNLAPHPFTSICPLNPSHKPDTPGVCCFTGCKVVNFCIGSHWRQFSKSVFLSLLTQDHGYMVWSTKKNPNIIATEQFHPAGVKYSIRYLNKGRTFFRKAP